MEHLQRLLDEVRLIREKAEVEKKEADRRGENFNIFNVLGVTSDETRTHSAFIAELLDPNGSHGLGDQFLRLFIDTVDCLRSRNFETKSAKVHKELSIGGKNEDCTEGGRIDIAVESNGKAIIIENKIYAGDQEKQLVRYYNYGTKNYSNGFRLLYLTLNGDDASKYSREKLVVNEDYYTVAYNHEISDWLQRCIESSARHPLVRETLIQYQNLINQLTMNSMDKNSQEELLKLMSYPKNIDSICSILSLEAKWRENIFKSYVLTPLKEKFQELDIELKNRGVNIKRPEWKQYIRLDWGNTLGNNASIGITTNIAGPKMKQKIDSFSGPGSQAPSDWWPYGWTKLDGKYWEIPQMVNGELVDYLYRKILSILEEIKEKQLPM
ncbi:MAG TPA: PD-(D/E)XK nuclease family protein [Candidatus Alistipes stercorigallinarum]|nr:PD-(D/E)XK nuclease family protein [Candidatus Alistipes stercorigallinarum]